MSIRQRMVNDCRFPCAATAMPGVHTVLVMLGIVLVAAGGLKTYGLVVVGDRLLGSVWLLACAIAVEFAVAAVLMIDRQRRRAWVLGLAFFAFLAVVAWLEARTGRANCGCFGPMHVDPWFTLAFDLSAVAALIVLGPEMGWPAVRHERIGMTVRTFPLSRTVAHMRPVLCGALLCVVLLALIKGVVAARPAEGVVILEPQKWVGQRLPILDEIDIGHELAQGEWLLVLFRYDCQLCEHELPRYAELAEQLCVTGARRQIAAIEIPPFVDGTVFPANSPGLRFGRLSDRRDWFVVTPTSIRLVSGRVEEVRSRETVNISK